MQNFTHFASRIPDGVQARRGAAVTVVWLLCLPSFGSRVQREPYHSRVAEFEIADAR
jgi:hypothetical protein